MLSPLIDRIVILLITSLFAISCTNPNVSNKSDDPGQESGITEFEFIEPSHSGIEFENRLPVHPEMNILAYQYFFNGGGVAVGDINNDGLQDIYFTANLAPNKLYLNKGNFVFEEIADNAGVQGSFGWASGAQMVDINADGLLDIYVCRSGKFNLDQRRNKLFINNGDLTFSESASSYGLDDPSYTTHASFFDYDRDGDLDVYLLNHNTESSLAYNITDRIVSHPFYGDKLLENRDGKFIDVTAKAGIYSTPIGYGLGVATTDINNDGWLDIYICNDFLEHDYLYINQGNGTFKDELKSLTRHCSNFSMGADAGDMNNDGFVDIMVVDMAAEDNYRQKANMSGMNPESFYNAVKSGFHYQYMFNALQLNNGIDGFSDIAQLAEVASTDWSWAALWADFDNDGWKDLFVTNGLRRDMKNKDFVNYQKSIKDSLDALSEKDKDKAVVSLLQKMPSEKIANYMFKSNGDLTFSKVTDSWKLNQKSFSNGAAYADLDNDGDLDLVINNVDQKAFLYRNNNSGNNYLRLALKGNDKNTFAIGSRVYLEFANGDSQVMEMQTSRGYQSSVEPFLHFGLGKSASVKRIIVLWPDGKVQGVDNPEINTTLTVEYNPEDLEFPYPKIEKKFFSDKSETSKISGFSHTENIFDDFLEEILLPHRTSRYGPALSIGDINGDKLDDIFLGGAKGYPSQLILQNESGQFYPSPDYTAQHVEREDISSLFFDADGDKDLDLYVVSGGNEFSKESPELQDRLYFNENGNFVYKQSALPSMFSSGGLVVKSDFDADGDIDLFVGGRLVPGTYPFPAKSYILQNDGAGNFSDVTDRWCKELVQAGMVTSALWEDINNDGKEDLVVAGEWMPIRTFINNGSEFVEQNLAGFENTEGWWFDLAAGDIDGDEDMDIIAGNLGLNYKFKASTDKPFKIYTKDFDGNGSLDIVLSYYQEGEYFPVRGRQCSSEQMPFIKKKFENYHTFASSSLVEIYSEEALSDALTYDAKTFASIWLEKTDNGFVKHQLPSRSQISNINSFLITNIDGDSDNEILSAGNLYESEVETPRNDASIGLAMELIDGEVEAIPPHISGFVADGNVRKMEMITLADGSRGILIARNNYNLSLLVIESDIKRLSAK